MEPAKFNTAGTRVHVLVRGRSPLQPKNCHGRLPSLWAFILENPSRSAIRLLVSTGSTSVQRKKQEEFISKGTQGNSCLLQRASLNNYGSVQRNIVARRQFIVEKEDILVRRINISHHVYKESRIKKRTDSVQVIYCGRKDLTTPERTTITPQVGTSDPDATSKMQ
ncbi:hypothetical protein B9Z55_016226 [Caenorhabditis nigoni]|nr:hypothetical protein B9Z55_016226 [Caenorhabditis nigoni]